MSFALVKSKEKVCRERAKKIIDELYLDEFHSLRKSDFSKAMALMRRMKIEEAAHFESFMENYTIGHDFYASFDASDTKTLKDFNKALIEHLKDI